MFPVGPRNFSRLVVYKPRRRRDSHDSGRAAPATLGHATTWAAALREGRPTVLTLPLRKRTHRRAIRWGRELLEITEPTKLTPVCEVEELELLSATYI